MNRAITTVAALLVGLFALVLSLGALSKFHNDTEVKIDIKNVWDHTTYVDDFSPNHKFTVIDGKTMARNVMRVVVERQDGEKFETFYHGERTFVPGETVTIQNHKYDSGKVPFDIMVLVAIAN
jgi:hypothetical protein